MNIVLIKHMFKIYISILQGCIAIHGFFSVKFFKWLIVIPIYLCLVHFTLLLDKLIFPGFKKIEIKEPVFILGHPRSGTTLLHRILTESEDYLTFEYWEMKFPALITRPFLNYLINILVKLKKDVVFPNSTGHETRLKSIEEEDLLFVLLLDTLFLLFLTPIKFGENFHNLAKNVIHDFQDHNQKSVSFLKECLKRQAYYKNKSRVVAKMNTSILRIQTLYQFFPDAKFIYLLRDPAEAIPSSHSLITKLQKFEFGEETNNQWYEDHGFNRQNANQELYRINQLFYSHFYQSIIDEKIPKAQVLFIKYTDLCNDLENTIQKISSFANLNLSEDTKNSVKTQSQNQKNYKRAHQVASLQEINISEEQIKRDLPFLFESGNFMSLQ